MTWQKHGTLHLSENIITLVSVQKTLSLTKYNYLKIKKRKKKTMYRVEVKQTICAKKYVSTLIRKTFIMAPIVCSTLFGAYQMWKNIHYYIWLLILELYNEVRTIHKLYHLLGTWYALLFF